VQGRLESKGFGSTSIQALQRRKHAAFLYIPEMAEIFIEQVGLTLPYEICLMIYSFMFAVDFEVLEKAQAIRKCFQDRGLPPQSVCLEEEAYRSYRQNPERRKHWPDDLKKAFFDGIVPPSTTQILIWLTIAEQASSTPTYIVLAVLGLS